MLKTSENTHADVIEVRESPRLVTRVMSDRTGRKFRLTFAVGLVNGEVKAQLISAEPILELSGSCQVQASKMLCLPCMNQHEVIEAVSFKATSVPSPYIELYFFTSQPTRAPSHR